MIFWDLLRVFVLSLLAVTGILIMAVLAIDAPHEGWGLCQGLMVIPLFIPGMLPYTVPMTALFATCVVYGRLSRDQETLALQSAGVNILWLVWPAVALGLLSGAGVMTLFYRVIPHVNYRLLMFYRTDIEKNLYTVLSTNQSLNWKELPYVFFVQDVQGRTLVKPIVKHRDGQRYDTVCCACEGEVRFEPARRLMLFHIYNGEVVDRKGSRIHFEDRILELQLPPAFWIDRPRRPNERDWLELLQRQREVLAEGKALAAQLATDLPRKRLTALTQRQDHLRWEHTDLELELHTRLALSLGCLGFVVVGCLVGTWSRQGGYLSAFTACFLPIVLLYYPLLLCGLKSARMGCIPAALGAWPADVVLGLAALVLCRRLRKPYRPLRHDIDLRVFITGLVCKTLGFLTRVRRQAGNNLAAPIVLRGAALLALFGLDLRTAAGVGSHFTEGGLRTGGCTWERTDLSQAARPPRHMP
jgi:lipopolysaccharide export system permease protein